MKQLIFSYCLFLITLLASCSKSELDGDEFIKYVENESNNLKTTKEIGDLSFQLQYCPTEYLLLKEYKTDRLPNGMVEQRKKENDSLQMFKLRIKTQKGDDILNYGIGSMEDYHARMEYLSYGFEENIALVTGTDTIFPAIFHFERTYGVAPFADFMMAFNTNIKHHENFQIIIDDNVFNTGLLKFSYNNIQNTPKLKTM